MNIKQLFASAFGAKPKRAKTFNEFFDTVVCLTTDAYSDRARLFKDEASKWGIRFEFFEARKGETPFDSFNKSQRIILSKFLGDGGQRLLVFEDDAIFKNMEILGSVFAELPEDWNIIYFGINARFDVEERPAKYYSPHLRRIYKGWTTHAVGYSKKAVIDILTKWENVNVYDAYLDEKIVLNGAFACVPFVSVQRPNKSELWNSDVNYLEIFQKSEDYLNSVK